MVKLCQQNNTENVGVEFQQYSDGMHLATAYVKNALGDVVGTYDVMSGVTLYREYCYDAYGNAVEEYDFIDTTPPSENPFRYRGEYYDTETGLYYLRNRYYDPQTGRFITEDTHWNTYNMIYGDNSSSVPDISAIRQSGNLYSYCSQNPILYRDPSGRLEAEDEQILSREDYLQVLYLTLAFEKAKAVKNRKAMDAAACQAASIRQKPEYNGKYSSQWEDGTYKKTYQPAPGFRAVYGQVFVEVHIIEFQDEADLISGRMVENVGNALGGGVSGALANIGNACSILSLFGDEEIKQNLTVGWSIVKIQIHDYSKYGEDFSGNYLVTDSNFAFRRNEVIKRHIVTNFRKGNIQNDEYFIII